MEHVNFGAQINNEIIMPIWSLSILIVKSGKIMKNLKYNGQDVTTFVIGDRFH